MEQDDQDHHCMWINNCVGYWNYKAFFLLTLYATIASIHSTAIFISFVLQNDWDSLKGRSEILPFDSRRCDLEVPTVKYSRDDLFAGFWMGSFELANEVPCLTEGIH
ncbi:hypothetical protein QN277_006086 [Acacia crassicarpa]|uniref:S-acyltransferase n=1 Tax=Acacia crassicarpa TaxID=499986 RepID=A0AAE1IXL0_9FABA|nr:hypothetical protein QN277_006086 [Acacia crassicarpa]